MNTERDLSESLQRQAERFERDFGGRPTDLETVRVRARGIRRRRRTTAAVAVAVAVAAIAVPSALVLAPQAGRDVTPANQGPTKTNPGPTPANSSTPRPSNRQSQSPSSGPATQATKATQTVPPTRKLALAHFVRGAAPASEWVQRSALHYGDGSTTPLPKGVGSVDQFTGYVGGWVFSIQQNGMVTRVVKPGQRPTTTPGQSQIIVSGDGTQAAYVVGDKLHVGLTNSMANSDSTTSIPGATDLSLVGFGSAGAVVYNYRPGNVRSLGAPHGQDKVPGVYLGNAVSADQTLVSGYLGNGRTGGVLSLSTGKPLWTSPTWLPSTFSSDGKYVAATKLTANGETDTLAILAARTGALVNRLGLVGNGIYLHGTPLWDGQSDTLLFVANQAAAHKWAILRLDARSSRVTRASDVVWASGTLSPFSLGATH
ncbi:MAG: hypothetical protein M3130_08980 [Actinomycetota bacterium]|nr:hypothetical protein [Actinomycetota bacterium]